MLEKLQDSTIQKRSNLHLKEDYYISENITVIVSGSFDRMSGKTQLKLKDVKTFCEKTYAQFLVIWAERS